ncbi:MAG: SUMF1/EgtB/PvdO family nonheme iron enzyme, partial [Raineya sp.]|nr:SUMF1/EgtB/PvdO family nonheme iron enzyme [Raineya sp.]
MKIQVQYLYLAFLVILIYNFSACSLFKKKDKTDRQSFEEMQAGNVEGVSQVTGIPYNDSTVDNSMFVAKYYDMPNAPNMVFIEGGAFVMGITEEDVVNLSRNRLKRVIVPSFYMDRTEIANIHWLEFMNFFYHNRDSIPAGMTFEEFAEEILLPDTTVWASEASANDAYVKNYLRHPGFRMYPVVGVTWIQAQEFCKWRTKMVNHYQETKSYYTGVKLDGKLTVGYFTQPEKIDTANIIKF